MKKFEKEYDVIIVGSGASGSVMAYEVVKSGKSVLVLEKGKYEDPKSFVHDELEMYARLYKGGGLQTTRNNDVTIAQGATVGGSTVINNAIWIRPDVNKMLEEWRRFGAYIDKDELINCYEYVEKKLKVSPLNNGIANKGSDIFIEASKKKGYDAHLLTNNREKCLGCGWCNYGCRYNRKTSMLVTFIPWAENYGATICDLTHDIKIKKSSNKITNVQFKRLDKDYNIQCKKLVICAGAVGSSEILLRNKINPTRLVGKGFHCLGGFFVNAILDKKVNGYDGIGLTSIAHVSTDYLIETFFAPPGIFSISLGGWFRKHHEYMLDYTKIFQAGVMVASEPTGRIKLSKGRAKIYFKYSDQDLSKLKEGFIKLAEIMFEMGAKKVIPSSFKQIEFDNLNDLKNVDDLIRKPDDLILGSAHPQGGNRMSNDPKKGVVNFRFKVHGYDNLYVVDASVFPYNIKANCQATVMAMSKYASHFVIN